MSMKRRLAFLISFILIMLSACGGEGNPGSTGGVQHTTGLTEGNSYISCPLNSVTTAAEAEEGEITLTVSGWASSPAEDALVQKNLKAFQDTHPNIKINWSPITGDYATKMRANIASGNVPDVFYTSTDMNSYITSNKLLNLSPYMDRDGIKAEDYYASLITPFSCQSGQVFGLPKDWGTLGIFYNKKMFSEAGIEAPDPNWTWEDMREIAKNLTKKGDVASSVYGLSVGAQSQRWLAFMLANGGKVLNEDGNQAAFNDAASVESLEFFTSFQKDGSSVQPADVAAGWAGDALGKKRAAMVIEGPWLIPYLKENFKDVEYDIAPLPVAPNGQRGNLIFTNAWGAYAETKHPEAAWQLIKFMSGEQVQKSQLEAGFALPAIKSLADDPYFQQNPGFKILFESAEYGYADNFGPYTPIIHTELDQAIEKVLLNQADPKTALDEAANRVNIELLS